MHPTEEQLVAFHFGDTTGDETTDIERHLHECDACRQALAEVRRTLAAVESLPVPERSEHYGTEVWIRILPELHKVRERSWLTALAEFFAPRRMVFAGAVAALVLAAFVAGRYWPGAPGTPGTEPTLSAGNGGAQPAGGERPAEEVREKVLLVAVGDHLERSQMALVDLSNTAGGQPVDISLEQERARELLSANRLIRQSAQAAGQNGVASVLDELERVLLEIANSPSTLTPSELEKVRERIETQGLIFKVRILGDRVREDVRPAPPSTRGAAGV